MKSIRKYVGLRLSLTLLMVVMIGVVVLSDLIIRNLRVVNEAAQTGCGPGPQFGDPQGGAAMCYPQSIQWSELVLLALLILLVICISFWCGFMWRKRQPSKVLDIIEQ